MRSTVGLLFAAIAASFLNLFLQLPLTPVLARSLSQDLTAVAFAVSAYSIANLAGNLFAGLVVDRFHPVPVMAGGLLAGGLALLALGEVGSIGWLAGCMMLNGLALSVVTPAAYAMLARVLPASGRARGMASSGALIGLAALVGPPLAGGLGDRLGQVGAYRVIGMALVAVALALLIGLRRAPRIEQSNVGLGDLVTVLAEPALLPAYMAAFALMFANGSLVFILPPLVKGMGVSGAMTGALFSAFAVTAIAVFLSPAGRRAYQGGAGHLMSVGAAVVALALVGLSLAPGLVAMGVAMAIYGIGFGMIFPAALATLVAGAHEDRRGSAFGLFYAFFSLGAIAGPFTLARFVGSPMSPFLIAAVVPAVFAAIAWRRRPAPSTDL
jgi:MFS family permease